MRALLTLLLPFLLLFSAAAEAGVVWLKDKDNRNIFDKGYDALKDRLAEQEKLTKSDLREEYHLYVDTQEVKWEVGKSRIAIILRARASGTYNTKTSCQALIAKEREVLFDKSVRNSLREYFPNVTDEDLRYLVLLRAEIDTFGIKSANSMEEVAPSQPYDPAKVTLMTSTRCRTSAPSDNVFFD